jgi:hypothetical protein
MREFLTGILFGAAWILIISSWLDDAPRAHVPSWISAFADKECDRGWRKITVTEKSIGVHCRGGGLHVIDWANRRVAGE